MSNGGIQTTKGVETRGFVGPFLISYSCRVGRVVRQAEGKQLLESIEIGERKVKVSMLQYADDNLFCCKDNFQSLFTVKSIMYCFKLTSYLKVYYSKSRIGGKSVSLSNLNSFASILNCDLMKIPFTYLGMKVGGNHKRCKSWEGVLGKVRKWLDKWKGKRLSMAGRIFMIKSVLTSIPLFYLLMFFVPVAMMKELKKVQWTFFWGWGSEGKKIAWVSWEKVCANREFGGLSVIDIRHFNSALLGKWI